MKRYKLSLYNSGGYRDSDIIETNYEIKQDSEGQWCVIDNDQVIGGDDLIEEMLNESRGWTESYCILMPRRSDFNLKC